MFDKAKLEMPSLLVLFIGVAALVYLVFKPFLPILVLAAVLAVLLHTFFESTVRLLNGKRSAVAALFVVLVLAFCIVPLFFLGSQIFNEAQILYTQVRGNESSYIQYLKNAFENPIRQMYPGFSINVNDYTAGALAYISDNAGILVTQTAYILFETFLMLLAFFFFLRDGRRMLGSITALSPFREEHTRAILGKTYATIGAVMRGTLLVAVIRLLVLSFGFYVFGIPNALLWGTVAGIVGAVPGLGTLFSVAPAVLYLYLSGNIVASVGLALLGVFTIVLIDNMLTAYFIDTVLQLPSVFVLFSILGGILFFGPLGFILGPLVLALFLSILDIYSILAGHK